MIKINVPSFTYFSSKKQLKLFFSASSIVLHCKSLPIILDKARTSTEFLSLNI